MPFLGKAQSLFITGFTPSYILPYLLTPTAPKPWTGYNICRRSKRPPGKGKGGIQATNTEISSPGTFQLRRTEDLVIIWTPLRLLALTETGSQIYWPLPYCPTSQSGNTELQLLPTTKIYLIFHMSLFKHCIEISLPQQSQHSPPPIIVHSKEEYLEGMGSKWRQGKLHYFADWGWRNTYGNRWKTCTSLIC